MHKFLTTTLLGSALAFGGIAPAQAQDMSEDEIVLLETLEANLPGTLMNNPVTGKFTGGGKDSEKKRIKDDSLPHGKAFSVTVANATPDKPWSSQVSLDIDGSAAEGDMVLIAMYIRAPEGGGAAKVVIKDREDNKKVLLREQLTDIGPDWMVYHIPQKSKESFEAGSLMLTVHLAEQAQTVEFGPVYVMNLGPDAKKGKLPHGPVAPE